MDFKRDKFMGLTWTQLRGAVRQTAVIGFSFMALSTLAVSARATLIFTNGSFETNTGNGQFGYNTSATGWATSGYNFLFAPGTADTTGAAGSAGTVKMWGPGDGSSNGLPSTSPDGGYYVAADGAYEAGAITQTVTGLTAGAKYVVGFWWAGAQQSGFTGITTEQWQVSFGSQTLSTTPVTNASEGFTGWMHQVFTFTADGTSDVLSFLAVGTPISPSEPPFSLLDGVTVQPIPEPGSIGLFLFGLFLAAGAVIFRSRKRAKI